MALSSTAQSAALRAIGPTLSSDEANAIMPYRDTRPYVGLIPTMPLNDAGWRIEPPVSVPVAAMAKRPATKAAEPPLEPPGTSLRAALAGSDPVHGLIAGPKWLVMLPEP